jgi:hypothetical protein
MLSAMNGPENSREWEIDSPPHRIRPESTREVRNKFSKQLALLLVDWKFRRKCDYLIVGPWRDAQAQIWCMIRKSSSGTIFVSIRVGLRFESIEQIDHPGIPEAATIWDTIESLRATRGTSGKEWDTSEPQTLPTLFEQIKTYAFPFFETHSTLDAVLAKLKSDDPKDWFWAGAVGRVGKMAMIMALKGQKQAALDLLDREIASALKSHPDPYASLSTRRALENCREKISNLASD